MRLVRALMPFTAQGRPLIGEDPEFRIMFDTFTYEAGSDIELPRDIPIGQINTVRLPLGSLVLDVEAALLNESGGMMPDFAGTGSMIGSVNFSLHENADDYGDNELGWDYKIYSSGVVEIMNGYFLNDENSPRFPEMQEEYHAALRALGFDEIVDRIKAGYDASLEGDVNYADEHHIERLLLVFRGENEY